MVVARSMRAKRQHRAFGARRHLTTRTYTEDRMAASKRNTKHVKIDEHGRRIGESKPRAKVSDWEVRLLRELVAELITAGTKPMEAYKRAAEKFEVHPRR